MSSELSTRSELSADAMERVLLLDDLSKLAPEERLSYYNSVCTSLGLNQLTKQFSYIVLNGKLQLYAKKDCTEQLRTLHGVSIEIKSRDIQDGVYVVVSKATNAKGRVDESIGAVPFEKLFGEAKANAVMKAETKSKRRVTLSICGLGMLDESEVGSIQGAQVIDDPQSAAASLHRQASDTRKLVEKTASAEEREQLLEKAETLTEQARAIEAKGAEVREEQTEADKLRVKASRAGDRGEFHRLMAEAAKLEGKEYAIPKKYLKDDDQIPGLESEVTAKNFWEVTCHIGKSNGPLLGRTMRELFGEGVKLTRIEKFLSAPVFVEFEGFTRDNPKRNKEDARLFAALQFVRKAVEARKAAEASTPPPAQENAIAGDSVPTTAKCDGNHAGPACADPQCWLKEPPKTTTPDILAKDDPLPETKAITEIDWRTAKVPGVGAFAKCTLAGKGLGELEIPYLRAIEEKIMAKIDWQNATDEERQFRKAFAMCLGECGITLDKSRLIAAVKEKVSDLAVSEEGFLSELKAVFGEQFDTDAKKLAGVDDDDLRSILKEWPVIGPTIKGRMNEVPTKPAKKGRK